MKEPEGRAWAEKNEVPYCDRVKALNRAVDVFIVLAPSNPEVHLDLCKKVFRFGKPTYVDKTFAPNLRIARKIFALADRYHVPMQTTSALRYTAVQQYVREVGRDQVRHMVAWGGGRSFGEYAIHPAELVVSCMGAEAESLLRRGTGPQSQLLLNFSGGRTAVINVYVEADTPFAASVTTGTATRHIAVDGSRLFTDTAAALLDFFDAGVPGIDRAESLMIRRILDVAEHPRALQKFVRL
jgi:predicted dehydrogenase